MKAIKKTICVLFCILFTAGCFAGCSSSAAQASEITDKTMLIAYTKENAPFIYKDKNGKLTGFDVDVIEKIFDNVKNDYKNYRFVEVEEGYKIGEDAAYTDKNGNEYIAYVMVGGLQRDAETFNKDWTFTEPLISNRVVTVTPKKSDIKDYSDLKEKTVGVVSAVAAETLDNHTAIKTGCKSVKEYSDIKSALADLDSGKINALITDEFTFCPLDNAKNYAVLDSELDTVNYVYAFKKYDWYHEPFDEGVYELKSKDYNGADEFTPIVEKYFGYDASDFDFVPVED